MLWIKSLDEMGWVVLIRHKFTPVAELGGLRD